MINVFDNKCILHYPWYMISHLFVRENVRSNWNHLKMPLAYNCSCFQKRQKVDLFYWQFSWRAHYLLLHYNVKYVLYRLTAFKDTLVIYTSTHTFSTILKIIKIETMWFCFGKLKPIHLTEIHVKYSVELHRLKIAVPNIDLGYRVLPKHF